MPNLFCIAGPIVCNLLVAGLLLADGADTPTSEKDSAAARMQFMLESVEHYELTSAPDAFQRHPRPLLRWNNPVGGVSDGIIVMWTAGKRPAILAQVFRIKDGTWLHECQSVCDRHFTMTEPDGTVRWSPTEAGVTFRELPNAPDLAEAPAARTVQLRALARRFSASDDFKIDSRDTDSTRHELRLMPKPLYRYQDAAAGVHEGAVFAFAHGTDPEVFLVLEARAGKDSQTSWHYALAPMTCWGVRATLDGSQVWKAPERLKSHTIKSAYHVWSVPKRQTESE